MDTHEDVYLHCQGAGGHFLFPGFVDPVLSSQALTVVPRSAPLYTHCRTHAWLMYISSVPSDSTCALCLDLEDPDLDDICGYYPQRTLLPVTA